MPPESPSASRRSTRGFHRRAADLAADTLRPCDGCVQAGRLRIKVVGHLAEVAAREVKLPTELAGVDVIDVHPLLRNPVPVAEYPLMTGPFYRLVEAAADPAVMLGYGARLARHLRLTSRPLPCLVGRKRACDGFRNVDRSTAAD